MSNAGNLEDRISERILDGDDPSQISEDLGVEIHRVLGVAHGVSLDSFSDYVKSCEEQGVSQDALLGILGIKIEKPRQQVVKKEKPYSNGRVVKKEAPWYMVDGKPLEGLEGIGDDDIIERESSQKRDQRKVMLLVSYFGRICGESQNLNFLRENWEQTPKDKRKQTQATSDLYHSAGRLVTDVERYQSLFTDPNHPILMSLKQQLEAMKEEAKETLDQVFPYINY